MYYICALHDDRRGGWFPQLFTRDQSALERFAKEWDRPGMSVYQCISTLLPNAQRRAKDTVAELTALHVDIDSRMLATSPEMVRQKLLELSASLPIEIRDSGGGFHVLVELKEPVRAGTPEFERANKARKALTQMLCGDPAPDHDAALLRKVGTHNTKYGEPRLCQVEKAGAPVELTDIEAFIELYNGPQFEWAPKLNGHAQKPDWKEPERENGFDDSPCAELNAAALKNLEPWVTSLLPDAKRRKGRYPAYDAVNPSRQSPTGRPYEQRNRNLGIVGSGIKDFGTGKGYSPLDLVMAVRQTSLAEAFCWLEEKLLPQKPDIEIDLDKIIEAQESPSIVSDGDNGERRADEQPTPRRRRINPMPLIRDAFGKIAHDTSCAIDLCHHTRKKAAGQDSEYTVADSRGGQSFIDAVRGARVLNTMSKSEATNFDLREDDRFDYMRLSRGKANMVRRGIIGWYHFVPVDLDNGSEEEGVAGDTVAVLQRWDPPKDSELVRQPTYEDRQYWLGALQYGEYRYDSRSPDWFGFKIADRLGADKNEPRQMKVVTAILDDLIEEGTFKVVEKKDAKRMLREFVVPGVLAGIGGQ